MALGHAHQYIIENIYLGAIFHDYGKAKIPEHILANNLNHVPEKDVEKCVGNVDGNFNTCENNTSDGVCQSESLEIITNDSNPSVSNPGNEESNISKEVSTNNSNITEIKGV